MGVKITTACLKLFLTASIQNCIDLYFKHIQYWHFAIHYNADTKTVILNICRDSRIRLGCIESVIFRYFPQALTERMSLEARIRENVNHRSTNKSQTHEKSFSQKQLKRHSERVSRILYVVLRNSIIITSSSVERISHSIAVVEKYNQWMLYLYSIWR